MSVRAIIVQYIGDTLFLPSFERKVSHIIVHNDNGGQEWEPIEFIVNCKDCKHYTDGEIEYRHYCNEWCGQVKPDGFCSWGERRNDG